MPSPVPSPVSNSQIPAGATAAGKILATAIAAPTTPSAGIGAIYVDSTSKNLAVKNDVGVVSHGARTKASVVSQFLTAIADDGTVAAAQPAFTDISGALVTAQITAAAVTYAKIQNVSATNILLGRKSAGAGTIEEITVAQSLSLLGILNGYQQQSRANAIALLGSNDLYEYFDDFDRITQGASHPNGWTIDQAGGAIVMNNSSTAEVGGTFLASITAVASNRANLYNATQNVNPGTKDLYVAFRMAVLSGADGNSQNAMGLTTTSFGRQLVAGVIGFLSSTTFQVAYNGQVIASAGSALSLGVAIDSAYHLYEFWIIGTTLKARIDGGTIQTAGSAISGYSPKSGYASLCSTGATAAVRSHEGSWMYVASLK